MTSISRPRVGDLITINKVNRAFRGTIVEVVPLIHTHTHFHIHTQTHIHTLTLIYSFARTHTHSLEEHTYIPSSRNYSFPLPPLCNPDSLTLVLALVFHSCHPAAVFLQ